MCCIRFYTAWLAANYWLCGVCCHFWQLYFPFWPKSLRWSHNISHDLQKVPLFISQGLLVLQIYCLHPWSNCFQRAAHCGLHLYLEFPIFHPVSLKSLICSGCIENLSSLFGPMFERRVKQKTAGPGGMQGLQGFTAALRYFLGKSALPAVLDRNHKYPMMFSKYFFNKASLWSFNTNSYSFLKRGLS